VHNNVVKLGDFGQSRALKHDKDVFEAESTEKLPIRWLPPEVMLRRSFSLKSDVWSFGVLMWEIYSNAERPYGERSLEQVYRLVTEVSLSEL
jgi:serine/threonine protein kinase